MTDIKLTTEDLVEQLTSKKVLQIARTVDGSGWEVMVFDPRYNLRMSYHGDSLRETLIQARKDLVT